MKIKNFYKFIESISGTLYQVNGPGMPRQELRNTISSSDTDVVFDEKTDKIYSKDEYDDLYQVYLTKGGKPLTDGFNKKNLELVLNIEK